MNLLSLQDLSIGYRHKTVAAGLTATLRSGGLTCLVGRNGLGKSTLLRTLSGFLPPLSGVATLNVGGEGVDLRSASKKALARLIGVVLTERVSVQRMTVAEVVAMGRMPYTGFFGALHDSDRQIVAEALRQTGLEAFARRDIGSLSDGERQKVMIAKALAQQTPVILLDEPTAFLDYPSKLDTMRLLRRLAHDEGKLVLVSTHDIDIALHVADRLLTIGQDPFSAESPAKGLAEVSRELLKRIQQGEAY